MNYHNITKNDMLNGDGLRSVLWVAGCNHFCKGCQNQQTHSIYGGIKFDIKAMCELLNSLAPSYVQGLTFSGGDPLHPHNRKMVTFIAKNVKELFSGTKDIWLYTGYLYEQVKDLEVMKYVDVLVDGPFVEALKDENYEWAGSRNQRIIRLSELREDAKR